MKFKHLIALVAAFTSLYSPSIAAVQEPDRAVVERGHNESKNGGFEHGLSNWTSTGGTFILNTTAVNVDVGNASGSWDSSSSSQVIASNTFTPKGGSLQDTVTASCRFKVATGTATHVIQLFDGTNIVAQQTITNSTSQFVRSSATAYVSSGVTSLSLRVVSVAANEPLIYIDDCYLGKSDGFNTSQVSQAAIVGSAHIATTASCQWTRTNAALGSFGTQSACPGPTVDINNGPGVIQTTDTDLPKFSVNNLPAGEYEVVITPADVSNGTAIGVATLAINDGTTTSNSTSSYTGISGGTGTSQSFPVIGHFSYSTSGNRTFELYGATPSNALTITNTTSLRQMNFMIKRFPGSPEIAVRSDSVAWKVDANISGTNPNMGNASVSTYTGIENGSLTLTNNTGNGNLSAQIPCSSTNAPTGTTCAVGNESLGISWTLPNAGDVMVCASFAAEITTAAAGTVDGAFQLVETPNNAQTISQEGKSRVNFQNRAPSTIVNQPISKLCGIFTFTSVGQKTVRLMFEQAVSGTVTSSTILGDADTARGQRDIHFEAYPMNIVQSVPVLFQGQVTTNSTSSERIERAYISDGANCTTATCTITSQSGSWLSTVSRTSQGLFVLNFTASYWATAPTCVGVASRVGTGVVTVRPTAVTTSAYTFDTRDAADAVQDSGNMHFICMGQH